MLGFEASGNLEYPEKTSWSERETLQQTRTTRTTQGRCQDSGTQATVVGVEGSVEIASCMGGSGFDSGIRYLLNKLLNINVISALSD